MNDLICLTISGAIGGLIGYLGGYRIGLHANIGLLRAELEELKRGLEDIKKDL